MKSPYLKPGGKKSPGGYLRYIATRDGVEMAEDTSRHLSATAEQQKQLDKLLKKYPGSKDSYEYQDYVGNPTRGNADALIDNILELHDDAPRRDIYLKYISERPGVEKIGANCLFTDEGVPIVLSQVQDEMNNYRGNIWTHIISLRREDAERLGYNTPDAWMHLLRSQRNMIAQQMKIAPENFRWFAAFHNCGHHPHVHMMAYSADPNEAYLTPKGIEQIKSHLAREIFQQDLLQIYQRQTDFRDELRHQSRNRLDEIVSEINAGNFSDPVMEQMLQQLSKKLSQAKGKKQYGYLKPEVKKLVDEIVVHLSGEEHIKELYDHWYDLREDVLRTYTDTFPERTPLEQNKVFKSIRNAVVQHALQIEVPPEDAHRFDPPPLSEAASPRVDSSEALSEEYQQAIKVLLDPEVKSHKKADAYRIIKQAANSGDTAAMVDAGNLNLYGIGRDKNKNLAEKYFNDAAIRGSVDAVYGMGKLYIDVNIQKAIGFFELAAAQGNTYAEYQLGKIYCFGLGIPRDLDKGMEWLRVSADHGNQYAASLLQYVQEHIHTATVQGVFGLLQSFAKMIQEDGSHQYQQRQRVDSKLKQKILEKKRALGLRSEQTQQSTYHLSPEEYEMMM